MVMSHTLTRTIGTVAVILRAATRRRRAHHKQQIDLRAT